MARLRTMPPLVFAGECDDLKDKLAAVSRGEAFLLQGGDCAETFAGVTAENVRNKLRVLLQMAVVLTYAASVPVVKLGRLAGQYAKPRSVRRRDPRRDHAAGLPRRRGQRLRLHRRVADPRPAAAGGGLPLVRGDAEPRARLRHRWVRRPAPGPHLEHRLRPRLDGRPALRGAGRRRSTRRCRSWRRSASSPTSCAGSTSTPATRRSCMEYEHAMTRIDSRTELPYNVSGHFVWIGERTRQLDGAHVEYFRHIRNPIGCKLGPTATARRRAGPGHQAQPRQRAGPADLHHPLRREQDPRRAPGAGREGHR